MRIIVLILILHASCLFSQNPAFKWAKIFRGQMNNTQGDNIAIDPFGNIFISGPFNDTTDFDPGPGTFTIAGVVGNIGTSDNFITKLDSSGNFLWARSISGPGYSETSDIKTDAQGNLLVAGYAIPGTDLDPGPGTFTFTSPMPWIRSGYVLKLDGNGNFLWAKVVGGGANQDVLFMRLDVDKLGQAHVIGSYQAQQLDVDPGPAVYTLQASFPSILNPIILKLNASGDFVWARTLSPINSTTAGAGIHEISVDDAGNVYTTGNTSTNVDFDPGPGTYTVSPATGTAVAIGLFVHKLNSAGNFLWVRFFEDEQLWNMGLGISTDRTGNVYATGNFIDTLSFSTGTLTCTLAATRGFNVYLTKLDPAGNLLWAKSNDMKMTPAFGNYIAVSRDKDIYLTGFIADTAVFDPGVTNFTLMSAGSNDGAIARYDSLGNFLWAGRLGGSNVDRSNSIAIGPDCNIYTTGFFASAIADFDPGAGTYTLSANNTNSSAFLLRLGQNCRPEEPLGINTIRGGAARLVVYPNPGTGIFLMEALGGQLETGSEVRITDLSGRELKRFIPGNTDTRMELNITDLPAGCYLLEVLGKNTGTQVVKVLKED